MHLHLIQDQGEVIEAQKTYSSHLDGEVTTKSHHQPLACWLAGHPDTGILTASHHEATNEFPFPFPLLNPERGRGRGRMRI